MSSLGRKIKFVHFSVFTTERDVAMQDDNTNEHFGWEETPDVHNVYFCCRKYGGQKFGIVELDMNGNATGIVEQKVTLTVAFDVYSEA